MIIQAPFFPPFFRSVERNNRKPVISPLIYTNNEYTVDFESFEETVKRNNVKMFILCNPHNPTGRVWNPGELLRLGQICLRNNVVVVSDEVHCDFTAPGFTHSVFAGLTPQTEAITVTLTAPGKTFNLSGLQISHAFIADKGMREAWLKQKAAAGLSELPDLMGMAACQAAYEYGRPWLEALLRYINDNDAFVRDYLTRYLRGIHAVPRQGTYLMWLNCRASGFNPEELSRRLIEKGRLWLADGRDYGKEGEGFQRLNLACPGETLNDAMTRLSVAANH